MTSQNSSPTMGRNVTKRKRLLATLLTAAAAVAAVPITAQAAEIEPPDGTVRVFWLRPTDVPDDKAYPDGIANVMLESQRFFKRELGKTFTLNDTIVEVVAGEHDADWYINNECDPGGDRYWCVVDNMQRELARRFQTDGPNPRWLVVGEISAEEPSQSGGGASTGWVKLSGHDADGAAGKAETMNRWYGGMVHELGHGFGLDDASGDDGTCMSGALYAYPNCFFTEEQKTAMLNGPFGSFLS